MKIYTEVLGNIRKSDEWRHRLDNVEIDEIFLLLSGKTLT